MHGGKTLFAQLMDFLPWTTFSRIVDRHGGDRRVRTFLCAEHFRVMAFAHERAPDSERRRAGPFMARSLSAPAR